MLSALASGALVLAAHPARNVDLVLELRAVPLVRPDAQLWIDGALASEGASALLGDLELWSGRVAGARDSHAFLALSRHGSRGWIAHAGRTWHLVADPDPVHGWERATSRWIDGASLAFAPPRACELRAAVASSSASSSSSPSAAPTALRAPSSQLAATSLTPLYECRLALETDYQYYAKFNDVAAATTSRTAQSSRRSAAPPRKRG